MRLKHFSLLCLLLILGRFANAQQFDLADKLQQYGEAYPQEKVYLHLDKPHYLTGDDIWLKGYVTIGPQNQLSALSKILYVDLVDPGNKVINSAKLLILHGTAIGDMHLTDTLQEGTYHLRAYTNWMRNLPSETFFNKAIAIGRPQVDPAVVQTDFYYDQTAKQLKAVVKLIGQNGFQVIKTPIKYSFSVAGKMVGSGTAVTNSGGEVNITFNNGKDLDVKGFVLSLNFTAGNVPVSRDIAVNVRRPENITQFMPEGGDMVVGLQSRVAFKMLQPDGLAATGSGYITDGSATTIVDFTSGFAGMGSFFLTPEAGKSYKAVITYNNGKKQTISLPSVLPEGFNLTVMQRPPAYVMLMVKASPALVKNQKLTILVQRQGKIIYTGQSVLNKAEALTKLPLTNVPSGLIQVTLFDEIMRPLCERLFFNINKKTLLPLTAQVAGSHQTRKQVTVTLNAGDATDSLRAGTFSASVINTAGVPPLKNNEAGILPGLLLTPELKGYVENPDHYFETNEGAPDLSRMTELDNLVLCQGWRRIVWNEIKAGNWAANNFKPEKSFSISGIVTKRDGGPAPKSRVSLLSTQSFAAMDTVTDAGGHFMFDNLLLKDRNRLALRAKDEQGKRTVKIQADMLPPLDVPPNSDIKYDDDMAYQAFLKRSYQYLSDSTKSILAGYHALKQVNISAVKDKKSLVPSYSANLNGPGKADEVYLGKDLENYNDLQTFLAGRALGIQFMHGSPYLARTYRDAMPHAGLPTQMRIYYDGVWMNADAAADPPAADPFLISEIPMNSIASVEILRQTDTSVLYGTNDGVIIITGKVGQPNNSESKASLEYLPMMLEGYHTPRQFYAPDYLVDKNTPPDHRITVYWKPDIVTDKQGNASFKFYTTDDKGTYRICVEGMTADGRPAHLTKDITVN